VKLDPARRAGILSLAGVMAALAHAGTTSPTRRGYIVLANLLCTPFFPPPPGVNAQTISPIRASSTPSRAIRCRTSSHS